MFKRKNYDAFTDDKIAHLYNSKNWTDCVFIFDNEKVSAHKLILTCSSPVFESMFYGSMASTEIQISDIEAEDFKQMLEYIYTDNINISSIINAWSLFYISQKYFLNDLKKLCINYINFNLTLSTLLLSYEYAQLFNLKQLSDRCWSDILLAAKELLMLDYHMQIQTLHKLLDEDQINADEKDLIDASIKWSAEECRLRNIEITEENQSRILLENGVFSKLRLGWPITDSYQHYLLEKLSKNVSNCNSFISLKTEKRLKMPCHVKYKFRETYKIEQSILLLDAYEFSCVIASIKKIVVYGIAITPPHKDGFIPAHSIVVLSIFTKCGIKLIEITNNVTVISDYEHPHLINLDCGLILEAQTSYKISVKYVSDNNVSKPNELLCYYLSNYIKTHENSMTISFNNEQCGGIVRGISFYVV